jgi:hypothetical protein
MRVRFHSSKRRIRYSDSTIAYLFLGYEHPSDSRATDNADELTLRLVVRQDVSIVRTPSDDVALKDPVYESRSRRSLGRSETLAAKNKR